MENNPSVLCIRSGVLRVSFSILTPSGPLFFFFFFFSRIFLFLFSHTSQQENFSLPLNLLF